MFPSLERVRGRMIWYAMQSEERVHVSLIYRYKTPVVTAAKKKELLALARKAVSRSILDIDTEFCFYIETSGPLADDETELLRWLLSETFEPDQYSEESFLANSQSPTFNSFLLESGPRMNFTTAWSSNAVSVCHSCGLTKIIRIERSRRYRIRASKKIDAGTLQKFFDGLYDRMTECVYPQPLVSFETGIAPERVFSVPLIEEGKGALEKINLEMGLGLDGWDIDYYYNLFVKDIGRNPTNVECFDLSQSNSEHSRHWFFRGRLVIDGAEAPDNLMKIIRQTLEAHPGNSVIAFRDNSSAIRGYEIETIVPAAPGTASAFRRSRPFHHIIFTAETHNFPSGVAPFPGAETGTGGRIRDVQATGRGALVVAGTAAYCVGNLRIPGYDLPWEDASFSYPTNLAAPLTIEIEASNGASDYGNKFGEPLIQGFTRSLACDCPMASGGNG
jgi:phosphoribosylformylglycinamidine synthase